MRRNKWFKKINLPSKIPKIFYRWNRYSKRSSWILTNNRAKQANFTSRQKKKITSCRLIFIPLQKGKLVPRSKV